VLVTTAATGEGVAELLAAIDRHRPTARGSMGADARFKRAEAQVWAVLVDRLHERVRALEGATDDANGRDRDRSMTGAAAGGSAANGEMLLAVAAHEMDPFEAADALLAMLTGGPDGPRSSGSGGSESPGATDDSGVGRRTGHRQA
jgi:putative protein kinase ArgK-like GTPase of G3E family